MGKGEQDRAGQGRMARQTEQGRAGRGRAGESKTGEQTEQGRLAGRAVQERTTERVGQNGKENWTGRRTGQARAGENEQTTKDQADATSQNRKSRQNMSRQ